MKARKPIPVKSMRFPTLMFVIALVVTGCSGSSDSESGQEVPGSQASENVVDNSSGTNESPISGDTNPVSMVPVDGMENESVGSPAADPEASPGVSQPSPTTVRVDFDIMVPAYMSNELQLRLDWGDINTTAAFISDESWSVSEDFPSNTENLLTVTFADRNGAITLGSVENTFRTGTSASENIQISADQFNTDRWDDDNDGVSNLDELIAGTNPDGNNLPQPVQASLQLLPVKTFRITWQSSPDSRFYRVLENPDGIAGFTDISGDLDATTTNFDHSVALYARVNAMYVVQSCNDQGCVDSAPLIVNGTLVDAIGYFKASNTGEGDSFGFAVALSSDGSTLAVGAPRESSAATGLNGDQADDSALHAGAVYLFARENRLWQQQAYIKASNAGRSDNFGYTISLSADGNTLAVGAPGEDSGLTDAGAVYTFVRSNNAWQEQAIIQASNRGFTDRFGFAISLSADGNTLAVGTPSEDSTATGVNGNQGSDLANSTGAAYVFVRDGGLWQQQAYIKASNSEQSDNFGTAVSISADGNSLVVGAPGEDSASTGINGDQSDNSASGSGALYIFVRSDGLWQQQAYIKASNSGEVDGFGRAVSLSANGNTLAVGAIGEDSASTGVNADQADNSLQRSGAVYVFVNDGVSWQQQAYIKASNTGEGDDFGRAVSLSEDGNTLAVGAAEDSASMGVNGDQDDNSESSGAVYLFVRDSGLWRQQAYIKASNTGFADSFAFAVSLSGDSSTLAVGAREEGSAAIGINGDQNDNSADRRAGAVYLY